jgi:DDE superfamily endonuclease
MLRVPKPLWLRRVGVTLGGHRRIICRVPTKDLDRRGAVAVAAIVEHAGVRREADTPSGVEGWDLAGFRRLFYECLRRRADALFELTDAVLCSDGPVRSLVELSLVGEHRRGHGSLYAALHHGRLDIGRLRMALAEVRLPRAADGRLVLAVDVTCWLRPDAHTSPERILCHTYGRGRDQHIMIPGWPYSFVVALEPGRSSWTAPLDALRLAPGDDLAAVTAAQLRALVARLIAAGQWTAGDPEILVVADAGYDGPRLAWLLADLPVQVLTRMRSDRVLRRPAPPFVPGPGCGRPPRHGGEFIFGDPASWGSPDVAATTDTRLYGTATVRAWDRLHPRLTRRAAWADCPQLPVIAGTVIRLEVDRLPSGAIPKPVWLWWSQVDATPADVDRMWQVFLRRFDIEHTFRLFKQTLGWTCPKIRTPQAADRWTWLILAAYTQLRLARPLAADLRRPWEKPAAPHRLSPARVRRGFRHLHAKSPSPAQAPKPSRPGPGRPPGRRNHRPTPRHDVYTATGLTSPKTTTKKPKSNKPANPRPRRTG